MKVDCPTCEGTGTLPVEYSGEGFSHDAICPTCQGTGTIDEEEGE